MSDVTIFKNKVPSAAFAALNTKGESLSDGITGGFGVLHYKGKNWSLQLGGEAHNFTRQDDGTPLAYVDVIILRQMPFKSKTYYPKGAWERGEAGEPTCASIDGITPDARAKQPQASACALCERNVAKASPDGRLSRECRDNKRLALLIVPALTKRLLGAPLMEPILLRVPAASLQALKKMGDSQESQGWHYSSYITRIGFVAESEFPQLTFTPIQALTEKEEPIVLPMREDPQAYRITGESELNKPRPTPQIALDPVAQMQRPTAQATGEVSLGVGGAGDNRPPPARSTPVPPVTLELKANEPETIDAGFGDDSPPAKVVQLKPVTQTLADTGETEESSAEMDAQIAALLKTS